MVRIPGFHPGDPGSSPGVGTIVLPDARLAKTGVSKDSLGVEELWRNGSASDSRSDGWAFESLWLHFCLFSGGRFLGMLRDKIEVPTVGLEPTTTRLRVLRSTD